MIFRWRDVQERESAQVLFVFLGRDMHLIIELREELSLSSDQQFWRQVDLLLPSGERGQVDVDVFV